MDARRLKLVMHPDVELALKLCLLLLLFTVFELVLQHVLQVLLIPQEHHAGHILATRIGDLLLLLRP